MASYIVPAPRTGFQEFTEAFTPGLERAFQLAFQRKMEEEQRKRAYQEAENLGLITKQPYQEVPVQGGTAQIAPLAGVNIPTKYKFKPTKGTTINLEGGIPRFGYEKPDDITQAYRKSQLELNQALLDTYRQGSPGEKIFRDIRTGEEVDELSAAEGMRQGKQYNVFLRTPTRSGLKETKIAEPPKLSEDQVGFISAYEERKKDLDTLINELTPETKAPLGGFARISSRKRFLVPEPELRKIQEPYTRVIQAFLFGPAGKALTGMEREVLERAASPTGKTPEEWERDLVSARNIMDDKYRYLTTGELPIGVGEEQPAEPNIDPLEGKIATNPKTGQKIIKRGGRWLPIQ